MTRDRDVMDDLLLLQDRILAGEQEVRRLKIIRDELVYEANEIHTIPLSAIARAVGLRRETVAQAKIRTQLRYGRQDEQD